MLCQTLGLLQNMLPDVYAKSVRDWVTRCVKYDVSDMMLRDVLDLVLQGVSDMMLQDVSEMTVTGCVRYHVT